jgi:hypothetical protein
MYVAACTRSLTSACTQDCIDAGLTPRITNVDVPTPSIWAPIDCNIAHKSPISGSRAALEMVVTPSATTAAIRCATEDTVVCQFELCTHRLESGQVHVDRSTTEVITTWKRQLHISEPTDERTEDIDRGSNSICQSKGDHGRNST